MYNFNKFLFLILLLCLSLLSYKVTFGFFKDNARSQNNIIAATAIIITSPTPTPTINLTPTPTGIPLANHVVISEVQIRGANANQDFVELYNPTSITIDLSSWKLRKRRADGDESSLILISSGKSIPAHGFFLWANNQNDFNTNVGADDFNGSNISPDNSVALLNSTNTMIDQVAWGIEVNQFVETAPFNATLSAHQSLERKAQSTSTASSMGSGGVDEFKGNGFDTDNNSTDFIFKSLSQPQNSTSGAETP